MLFDFWKVHTIVNLMETIGATGEMAKQTSIDSLGNITLVEHLVEIQDPQTITQKAQVGQH